MLAHRVALIVINRAHLCDRINSGDRSRYSLRLPVNATEHHSLWDEV